MNRLFVAALAVAAALPAGAARAADGPPTGTWKVIIPFTKAGNDPLWLVKFETKDGKWIGEVVSAAGPSATLEKLSVENGALKFTLRMKDAALAVEAQLPKDGDRINALTALGGEATPVKLLRTEMTSLTDRFELVKEVYTTQAGEPASVRAALEMIELGADMKVRPTEARLWAEKAIEWAKSYGPAWERETTAKAAELLASKEAYRAIAIDLARKAEKGFAPKDRPSVQRRILKVLAEALKDDKKDDEAKAVLERMEKIDLISLTPFAGRTGDSDRVALVELFTGADCPPCVAADLAFDGFLKTYKPTDVILLEYHLHIPRADPLTNADGVERMKFYGIQSTPNMFVNGEAGPGAGGPEEGAQDVYEDYLSVIKASLEKPSKVKIKLQVVKKDGKFAVKAETSDLESPGKDVCLRFALVEDHVEYTGSNKVALHHCVVRGFPGGADGTALTEKMGRKVVTVDFDAVRETIKDYLPSHAPYSGKLPELAFKQMKLVAFVQDNDTKTVLQAQLVDLPAE